MKDDSPRNAAGEQPGVQHNVRRKSNWGIARELVELFALPRSAGVLRSQCRSKSLASAFELVNQSGGFKSNQKPKEILALLQLLEQLKPRRLCEIGAEGGGNLLLFSFVAVPDAQIISIDLHYAIRRKWAYPRLAAEGQRVSCIRADSHSPKCLDKVRRLLGDELLDFLFIDGDHSYKGVAQDFEMYSPLVRDGGIIAFHDIVSDFRTRYGTPSECDVGEVPKFWAELKRDHDNARELVQDDKQDGFGIGVLEWRRGSAAR